MGEFVLTSVFVKKNNNRAMEEEEDDDDLELVSCKKRKLYVELQNEYEDVVESSENPAVSSVSVSSKCDDSESGNSYLRSPDLKDVHLESEDFEYNCLFSSPKYEIYVDSEQGLMCQSTISNRKLSPAMQTRPVMMPIEGELEEFFAAAEKSEQKRFAEKYNYDIIKDVPLEGKYEWVRLHP